MRGMWAAAVVAVLVLLGACAAHDTLDFEVHTLSGVIQVHDAAGDDDVRLVEPGPDQRVAKLKEGCGYSA